MEYRNLFSNGARLVWRHQRILWWIFFVNFALAWFGSSPFRSALSPLLDHSVASQRLVGRFDLAAMIELLREPAMQIRSFATASMNFALVFLIYMIFIDGGVLTVFREDRKLTKAEFFELSGGYFWRIVRLVLLSCIPFAILGAIFSGISGWSDKLTSDAANARTGFWVLLVGAMIVWLGVLFVRAWFDLAQCMTVANNDRGMLRNTGRSFMTSLRHLGTILSTYIMIHIVGIVSMIVLCLLWSRVPHSMLGPSALVLEVLVLIDIAVRLWQKAACMTFFESQPVAVATPPYELAPIATIAEPGEPGEPAQV
jgi:hypothetical protein